MKLLRRRGQSTGEYAILFAIVLGAVIAMQNFVKHRISGVIQKTATDYSSKVGAGVTTITTTSISDQESSSDMTKATDGRVGSKGTGTSKVTTP